MTYTRAPALVACTTRAANTGLLEDGRRGQRPCLDRTGNCSSCVCHRRRFGCRNGFDMEIVIRGLDSSLNAGSQALVDRAVNSYLGGVMWSGQVIAMRESQISSELRVL